MLLRFVLIVVSQSHGYFSCLNRIRLNFDSNLFHRAKTSLLSANISEAISSNVIVCTIIIAYRD